MFLLWLGFVPVLLCSPVMSTGALTFHMNSVIGILKDLEFHLNGTLNLAVRELFRELEYCNGKLWQQFLCPMASVPSDMSYLNEPQRTFLRHLVNHTVDASLIEHGVVLTPDGTTISLSPLLAGIAVGSKRRQETVLLGTPLVTDSSNNSRPEPQFTLDPLFATTIAMDLGMAFLLFQTNQSEAALGPNGCWDNISAPHTFTLMGPPSNITDAFINGAMDGLVLGALVAEKYETTSSLSALLGDYYGRKGLIWRNRVTRSNFRRNNFAALVSEEKLRDQVRRSMELLRQLNEDSPLFEGITSEETGLLANQAVDEFMALYVECPAIIPRCMWGARPYRGTPAQLTLPLNSVYVHHTSTPSKPCQTFSVCAADMRSMQRFHQDVRGWDDIGYSFIVGSDGYLYQGRGWHWVGAHTLGYNSKGFGVSFIGDYMKTLPATFALELLKNNFLQCAVRGSRLQANYTIYGHRQMVLNTSCPGDRLFQEIETWKRFKVRCFMDKGAHSCV
ncbi:N-acetylmuramoyl-L-alanine amidase [Anolis carolinensis]|uniref:N-acetylmuramoyl-L-alanine amidase n=1 Tax=Anolis carolinensis TaxID=28377 RepID=UPI002F2B4BB5